MRLNLRTVGLVIVWTLILLLDQRLVSQTQSVVFTVSGRGTSQLGSPQTVTATLIDSGSPVANAGVSFRITSGPRAGMGALIYTHINGPKRSMIASGASRESDGAMSRSSTTLVLAE